MDFKFIFLDNFTFKYRKFGDINGCNNNFFIKNCN